MDLQQAKILLEKINALHKSVSLDKGDVSSIERDLMLSYIRQLYEAYLNTEVVSAPAPKAKPAPPKVVAPAPPPAPEKVAPPPPPAPKPEPIPEPVAPPKPAPESEPVAKSAPAPQPQAAPSSATPKSSGSSAINALFKHKEARELSEKLSQQAISDLTRAMSINDKLLYSNELFGRDMASMNETLQQLNKLSSMDQAQEVLVGIAQQFDWSEEERADVAQSFIKLVRRKY